MGLRKFSETEKELISQETHLYVEESRQIVLDSGTMRNKAYLWILSSDMDQYDLDSNVIEQNKINVLLNRYLPTMLSWVNIYIPKKVGLSNMYTIYRHHTLT